MLPRGLPLRRGVCGRLRALWKHQPDPAVYQGPGGGHFQVECVLNVPIFAMPCFVSIDLNMTTNFAVKSVTYFLRSCVEGCLYRGQPCDGACMHGDYLCNDQCIDQGQQNNGLHFHSYPLELIYIRVGPGASKSARLVPWLVLESNY